MLKKVLIIGILAEIGVFGYLTVGHSHKTVKDNPSNELKLMKLSTPSEVDMQAAPVMNANSMDSMDNIIQKYRTQMESLEKETEEKFFSFIVSNIQKLSSNLEIGDILTIGRDAKQLEAQTDNSFNELYQKLENELEQNGYSKDNATPLKEEYKQKKEAYLKQILSIVTSNQQSSQ